MRHAVPAKLGTLEGRRRLLPSSLGNPDSTSEVFLFQKPGDRPNFRKNALGVKRPFSELSESSGVFSEQLSELEIPFSETKFHSRNGLSRLDQYETHNSRSNSRSDSRNCREPTRKIFICPCIPERFFKNWGGPRAPDFSTVADRSATAHAQ